MTRCYEVPITLFVNAHTAEDAITIAGEELHYLCKCDNPVVAYEYPEDNTELAFEEMDA